MRRAVHRALTSAVELRGVSVVRGGREVLREVDLTFRRGSVTGLLGPSGSGKSTLIRTVVGVQDHVRGEVVVLGSPAGAPDLRSRVAYLTQAPSIYTDLTVIENLRYFAAVMGVDEDEIVRVLDVVGLSDEADQPASDLSGGQVSRVSLATALLGEPELLVLDEPTVGLDPLLRADLWRMFHDLADAGATLVVSSHVMDEADRCNDIVLVREGSILAVDTPDGLRERTGTTRTEDAFIALIRGESG